MKVVGLISGGKDSVFAMMEAVRYGHEIIAVANLAPGNDTTGELIHELDSFMFQTVGHTAVEAIAKCMRVPLYQDKFAGRAVQQDLEYDTTKAAKEDEVEDLFNLLSRVKAAHPELQGVTSGAVLSNYQRFRVENVCTRLGLTSFAYLWQCHQPALLRRIVESGIDARMIKIASMGLKPSFLGQSIAELEPTLLALGDEMSLNVCGEGGEYESLTVDCPLFHQRVELDSVEVVHVCRDRWAPVAYLKVHSCSVVDKPAAASTTEGKVVEASVASTLASPSTAPYRLAGASSDPFCRESGTFVNVSNVCGKQDTVAASIHEAFDTLVACLAKHSLTLDNVVFVRLILDDMAKFAPANEAYCTHFSEHPPARECFQLALPAGCQVCMEILASKSTSSKTLHVRSYSNWAPVCIGPYSQAKVVDDLVFIAGQIGLEPATMQLVSGGLTPQLDRAMLNVERVATALGCRHVVACTLLISAAHASDAVHAQTTVQEWVQAWNHCGGSIVDKDACFMVSSCGVTLSPAPVVVIVVPHLPRSAAVEVCVVGIEKAAASAHSYSSSTTVSEDGVASKCFGSSGFLCSAVIAAPAGTPASSIQASIDASLAAFGLADSDAFILRGYSAVDSCTDAPSASSSSFAWYQTCGCYDADLRPCSQLLQVLAKAK